MILPTSFNVAFLRQAGHILVWNEGNIALYQGACGCGSDRAGAIEHSALSMRKTHPFLKRRCRVP